MLRATTACTFSTSQLPKMVRERCVLYILTSKCALCHNGVHFFISHLASWLRTRRFSEPTFRPSGAHRSPKSLEKQSESRLSYLFAHLHLLSSYSVSSTLLSSDLSLLSASALLCFSSVHIVGSLSSKLPSIIDLQTAVGSCSVCLCLSFASQQTFGTLPTKDQSATNICQTQEFDRIQENRSQWYKTNQRWRTAFPASLWRSAMGMYVHSYIYSCLFMFLYHFINLYHHSVVGACKSWRGTRQMLLDFIDN